MRLAGSRGFRPTQHVIFLRSNYHRCLSTKVKEDIIFSGIQPTGVPHLGNYFGALSQWVELQNAPVERGRTLLFSVVGLHALTMPQDPRKLKEGRRDTLASILAIGVDPKKAILFFQEDVPQHSELAWLLNCITMMGRLKRMTTWKSKISTQADGDMNEVDDLNLNMGLFTYPVLQAADVLLYRTTHVPVGEDQRQHLELARELAQKMNRVMKTDFFPEPVAIINPAKRVLALKGDPPKKMSKSAPDPRSRILITDSTKEIHNKLRAAFTDSIDPESVQWDHVPTLDELSPGVANLYTILSCCTNEDPADLISMYHQKRYGHLKSAVAEAVEEKLAPIRAEFERLTKPENEGWLREVAAHGRERAREIADRNLAQIKSHLGLQQL
ncbi:Tryptophan--tRNA ligase, mitochondrial [Serendipita sp. 405]|nr:Tryptophan--tRNA ligase, mitochondrial [Serendipita sp. 405]